ncbi:two-component system chemotaxis response regulator CheB [Fluviicoccus keumensis]|uniref:Protein-glutamate methylesterase/protein-glutamine glutaminase n=1 Tax=Fluviicoccus keumensis TaxID=1435465 RepID=A0A4Q7ZAV6_9GAMM|nr:chemotaxis-specific protein-glutamate methyltransferase CheB [Fluviicoccus keumensis]RZU47732.1 two-component system chemotaxis response regulator CheB [Fluviicoccus keumensis]
MIRILIAEDSRVVSVLLKTIFEQEPDMQVVGQAMNGEEAVRMARELKPDIVTMDIRMPVMDGFEATHHIMRETPLPIVVISISINDEEMNTTFRALEEGALAVIEKPVGISHPDFEDNRRDLVNTVRAMSEIRVVRRRPDTDGHSPSFRSGLAGRRPEVIAIGCSTGGPQALLAVLKGLRADFPVPIVVTQHMTKGFVGGLIAWLQKHTPLTLRLAGDRQLLEAGAVYFAPDEHHLLVERGADGWLYTRLDQGAPTNALRPSVTRLFHSVAHAAHGAAVGVLLTGMGEDGAEGLLAMRKAGCHTIVQDNASSVVYGMPGAALAIEAVDEVVGLGKMAAYLTDAVLRPIPV